ncbi:hypothetical protein I7I53_10098 [Histoplasma capsulatum var. duboisii H88]|uniref:Uncharacterized protein n=1 Tax=Ajellomyces capsulatus (strain H88) TaxID=544711 RepID=A0A8A1L6F9_AJEC8|nr:hypothetical protein I7I53_10098 [Histoplasma capsulatum var. duboisii H88]
MRPCINICSIQLGWNLKVRVLVFFSFSQPLRLPRSLIPTKSISQAYSSIITKILLKKRKIFSGIICV